MKGAQDPTNSLSSGHNTRTEAFSLHNRELPCKQFDERNHTSTPRDLCSSRSASEMHTGARPLAFRALATGGHQHTPGWSLLAAPEPDIFPRLRGPGPRTALLSGLFLLGLLCCRRVTVKAFPQQPLSNRLKFPGRNEKEQGREEAFSSSTRTKENSRYAISRYFKSLMVQADPKRDFLYLILIESKRNEL